MTATCPICAAPQDEGLVCATCVLALERDLGDVPALVAELDVTISRQARIGSGGKGGLASERTPVHLGAVQVADDLTNTLTTWARDVTGEGWPSFRMDAGPRLAAVCLLSHVNTIRRHPAAAELVDEVTDAIRQARRVVDRPADRVYLGQCLAPTPDEDGNDITCYEEIYASQSASEVTCKVCGITHPVGERRAWLLQKAEDMLVTVKEASSYMGEIGGIPVPQQRISAFIRWGKVAFRPGTETFRLGDLIEVVLGEYEKRTA